MEFKSQSGNTYYYDGEIGIAFPSNLITNKPISENPSQMKEIPAAEKNTDDLLFYSRYLEKINRIRPKHEAAKPKKKLTTEEIKPLILRQALHQIILGVTEDCNLRCRYCIYSEAYPHSRNRTKKKMDFSTAKKALDYYVSLFLEGREYNPVRRPSVAFYGGEPLMNFELIQKCVLYLETTYPELDFIFMFTTNGTLLTKDKEDFLMEHGFYVNFSIDGPKEEHDRNRVYPGNKGSFSDMMKNVRRFMTEWPNRCGALCVFDYKTNPFELDAFFGRSDIPRLTVVNMPSDLEGCTYYDQFSPGEIEAFQKTMDIAFRDFLEHGTYGAGAHSFFSQLFAISSSQSLYTAVVLASREQDIFPYSGACIPGRKIFVDPKGIFHICERINQYFPIGNVETGLNFQDIATLINGYNEHLDSCESCVINKECGKCFVNFAGNGSFKNASALCKNEKCRLRDQFSQVFTIGEVRPDQLNILVKDHYTWLSKKSPVSGGD